MYNEDFINIANNLTALSKLSKVSFPELYKRMDKELAKLRSPNPTGNILITQLNGMGDLVLTSGVIREIRKNYPNHHITLLVLGFWESLVKNCPYVDRIVPYFGSDFTLARLYRTTINFCREKLWERQYDFAINTHWGQCGSHSSFLNWFSGAKDRIAFDFYTEQKLFTTKEFRTGYILEADDFSAVINKPFNCPTDLYLDVKRRYWLLEQLGMTVTDMSSEIWLTDEDYVPLVEKHKNKVTGKKRIIVGLGASHDNKKYPVRKLAKALTEINKLDDIVFITIGGKTEVDDINYLMKKVPELNFVNYVNKLSLRQVAQLISQCDMYIGNDTGTIHMAKTFDLPTISMIYESKDVEHAEGAGTLSSYLRYSPWQDRCKHESIVLRPEHALPECVGSMIHGGCIRNQAHCITQIKPEEIVNAYKRIK